MKILIMLSLTMSLATVALANSNTFSISLEQADYSCFEGVHGVPWPTPTVLKLNLIRNSMSKGFNTTEALYQAPRNVTCSQLEKTFLNTEKSSEAQVILSYSAKNVKISEGRCLKVDREDIALLIGGLQFLGADTFTTPFDCQ